MTTLELERRKAELCTLSPECLVERVIRNELSEEEMLFLREIARLRRREAERLQKEWDNVWVRLNDRVEPNGTPGESGNATMSESVAKIMRMKRLGMDTFHRELPQFAKQRDGQWVAYHGTQRLGFAKNDLELYEEIKRRGIPEDEYIVCLIEEIPPLNHPHKLEIPWM